MFLSSCRSTRLCRQGRSLFQEAERVFSGRRANDTQLGDLKGNRETVTIPSEFSWRAGHTVLFAETFYLIRGRECLLSALAADPGR
jgi:hypothetical protein